LDIVPLPFEPAVKATLNDPLEGVMLVIVGAPGVVTPLVGVPVEEVDCVPAPASLTARIRTVYVVPFVRPVIEIGDAVVPVDRVVQFDPSLVEN
jgi:hypothetical protein